MKWTTHHLVSVNTCYKPSCVASNLYLDPNCYFAVVEYILGDVGTRWLSIGLYLGIPYGDMETFDRESTLEQKIQKMVGAWLSGKGSMEPTWRRLVEAVAARSGGGHQRLASAIAKDHQLGTGCKCWVLSS